MIHGPRRYELMLDEYRRRDLAPIQDVQAELNKAISIAFRKISDGTDQPRSRFAEFRAPFGRSILTHDRAAIGPPRFLKRAQSAQGTGIVHAADKNSLST